jgi:hypothetical protein
MWAERFLRDLAHDSVKYPRVPKHIRREAYDILRHFPQEYEMKKAAQEVPDVFQQRIEPLTRMIMQYEQDKKS